jgi:hypothetical protein
VQVEASILMESSFSDVMISSCRCYGVPDLLQYQPILLRMGPKQLKFQPTLFGRVTSRSYIVCCLRWSVAAVDGVTALLQTDRQTDSITQCHPQVGSNQLCTRRHTFKVTGNENRDPQCANPFARQYLQLHSRD